MLGFLAFWAAHALYSYSLGSLSGLECRLVFNHYLSNDWKELEEQAGSGLSTTYYFTSYYLNGVISAAEGTENERLLRRAMRLADRMTETTQEFEDHGRIFRAWRPFYVTADSTIPRPSLHHTFQSMVPIARLAAVIMTHPGWRRKYEKSARRYTAFADELVIQYWYHERLGDEIPWVNPDDFPIWNDNGTNLGLIAVFLYQATGDPLYKDIALRIGKAFQAKLEPYKTGWIWENQTIPVGSDTDNTPGSVGNQEGVPDTSHTNREPFFMAALYESGLLFQRGDLERMAATLSDTLWNQSARDPSFSNYLDGSDKPYRVYKEPGLNGSVYHGWALMGGYSPKAQQVLLYLFKGMIKGRKNPSIERNTTSYGGRIALCGSLLRNFALLRHPPSPPSPEPSGVETSVPSKDSAESSFPAGRAPTNLHPEKGGLAPGT